MNYLKLKADSVHKNQPKYSVMSARTKIFIQKICYKKTASVDMTKNGFITDVKHPINLLIKSLREQLEKIWGKKTAPSPRKRSPLRKVERKDPASAKRKRTIVKTNEKIKKRRRVRK